MKSRLKDREARLEMQKITFGNEQITLQFNGENGKLEGFVYGGAFTAIPSLLWRIDTGKKVLDIDAMQQFSSRTYGDSLYLIWESREGKIIVKLAADEAQKIRWSIQVALNDGAVGKVEFPVFQGLRFDTDNELIVTWQNGRILHNPVENFLRKGLQVPFWMGRGKYAYTNDYPAGLSYQ